MKDYSLYIQRANDNSAKGCVENWNIAVVESCTDIDGGFRDLASREWADEDGEDVYIPASRKLNAYDAKWTLCYKGAASDAFGKLTDFRDWLSSGGLLMIYDPKTTTGRIGAYLSKFGTPTYWRKGNEEVLKFEVTFRITSPRKGLTATETDGVVTLAEN